ncbi:Kyphoscoliosis peptidase [Intoshia linei]|uniref:Kyphoscoliosis peptidase n=1 Tax=Intoshia linei TaxID=1819745 RepID=A0A177B2V3_9BILA|nr:Kyphoscoliosis peptidase [Intoshia linei]
MAKVVQTEPTENGLAIKNLRELFSAVPVDVCERCKKRVYLPEKVGPINGVVFHTQCFSCCFCSHHLTVRTYFSNPTNRKDKEIYCATHAERISSLGLDANSMGIKGILDGTRANALKHKQTHQVPSIDNESIQIKLHKLYAENTKRIDRKDLMTHNYPAILPNSKIYEAQKKLEEEHRKTEDQLRLKLEEERKKTTEKVLEEQEILWNKRLTELTKTFENELSLKDSARDNKKKMFEKDKTELRKTLTMKMADKIKKLDTEESQTIQIETTKLVEKHANEMIQLLKVKHDSSKDDQIDLDEIKNTSQQDIPGPYPPSKRKRDLFYSTSYFDKIDKYVLEMASDDHTTFTDLVNALTCNCETNLDKCRAIYRWITLKDLNNMKIDENGDKDTPYGLLSGIKSGSETYHTLFMRLCSYAGLHCREIKGHSKSVGYEPGMKIKEKSFLNTWNVVLIEGDWWPIQCNWGARHLVMKKNETPSINEDRKDEIRYQYDEHYFMTDPDEFIKEFWASDMDWQLLDVPITLKQFEESAFVRSVFFNYGLSFTVDTKAKAIMYTDDDGKLEIKLTMPIEFSQHLLFYYQLHYDEKTKTKKTNANSAVDLERYIVHNVDLETASFLLRPPKSGYYFLEIFVNKSETFKESSSRDLQVVPFKLKCACKFKIVVYSKDGNNHRKMSLEKDENRVDPLPKCALGEWGPMKAIRHFGIYPISHTSYLINTDVNSVAIRMRASEPVHVLPRLHNNTVRDEDLQNSFDIIIEQDIITINVYLPNTGEYGIDIYARSEKSVDPSTLSHACKYLIQYIEKDTDTKKFVRNPNIENNLVGPENNEKSSVVNLTSSNPNTNEFYHKTIIKVNKNEAPSSDSKKSLNSTEQMLEKVKSMEKDKSIPQVLNNVIEGPVMPDYIRFDILKFVPETPRIYYNSMKPIVIQVYTRNVYRFAYQLKKDNKIVSGAITTKEYNGGKKIKFYISVPTLANYSFSVYCAENTIKDKLNNIYNFLIIYNIKPKPQDNHQKPTKSKILRFFKK